MSTPNPEIKGDSPITQLLVSMSGASGGEHESLPPGADGQAVQAGHEPDKFDVTAILYVPAFLTAVVIVAFVCVTFVIFTFYTRFKPVAAGANPQTVQMAHSDINDRFARISSTVPKDLKTADGKVIEGTGVAQPRLEYLKETQPETPNDPAYMRTKRPIDTPGNTYEIRPEDLRPENYHDPLTRDKVLATYAWRKADKSVARMPIEAAIKLVIAQNKLPVKKGAAPADTTSAGRATQANAGRGGPSQPKSPAGATPKESKGGH